MSKTVYRIMELLCELVVELPVGTNLAVLHLLWMLLSGQLLHARGAVFPALLATGLSITTTRRAWAGLAGGQWAIEQLLAAWWGVVQREQRWQARVHGGYRALPVDLTGFFRPRLRGCATQHFSHPANKGLPAIALGLIVQVGHVAGFRLGILRALVRADPADPRDPRLQALLLARAVALSQPQDVIVADGEFKVTMLQAAGATRYVLRGAKNFTARRAHPPSTTAPKGQRKAGRKPIHGVRVRPLPGQYRGQPIAATPPDQVTTWTDGAACGRAACWYDLVPSRSCATAPKTAPHFHVYVLYDARHAQPLLLITSLRLSPSVIRALFLDRWPVEHPPLVAKQLLGAQRQFVFAPQARQRLPELALFAGSLLAYLAATTDALATGFWDRAPRPTAGRLRRALTQVGFPHNFPLLARIREKHSPTGHLPKGVAAHRRHPSTVSQASPPSPSA